MFTERESPSPSQPESTIKKIRNLLRLFSRTILAHVAKESENVERIRTWSSGSCDLVRDFLRLTIVKFRDCNLQLTIQSAIKRVIGKFAYCKEMN